MAFTVRWCGPGMLTEEAARVIQSAKSIYGSGRAIELVQKLIPKNCTVRSISDYRNLSQLPESAVVLSTGDPMLAGLGYLQGEVTIGPYEIHLGDIGGVPFYMTAAQYEYWKHTQLIIDVMDGRGDTFSLEGGTGKAFLTRSRLFTDAEWAALQTAGLV